MLMPWGYDNRGDATGMSDLKINQERYDKLTHKTFPKLIAEAEDWLRRMNSALWDFKMIVESEKRDIDEERNS
jgi:hypothetical protein